MRVTKALMPMLLASEQKKLIYIGSRAGSVTSQSIEGARKGQIIYRSSKVSSRSLASGFAFFSDASGTVTDRLR